MRKITEIILHCSATKEGQDYTVKDIDRWHRQQGWKGCGYHYVICRNGRIQEGRKLDVIGAHCIGHNKNSIGICYIGGLDSAGNPKDTRTDQQKAAMYTLLKSIRKLYPRATIHGHNEFAAKACPCFDVQREYGGL